MDRKLDRKHNNIDCWYNPGNGRLITYTYAYIKKKKKKNSGRWLWTLRRKYLNWSLYLHFHGGTKWDLDLDGLCQANRLLVTWFKSHGLKTTALQTPAGTYHLLQRQDTDVWAGRLQFGRQTLNLLQQLCFVFLKLPEDPEESRFVLFVFYQ